MRENVIGLAALGAMIAFAAWWHHEHWYECRANHSFTYCYQMVFQ